jgi:hypothetical protein
MLPSHGGYLIYVARTYNWMRSYLKGIFLTLNSWHPHRDAEGWKLPVSEWESTEAEYLKWKSEKTKEDDSWEDLETEETSEAPKVVRPIPRLLSDVEALTVLTESVKPPLRFVRPNKVFVVLYRGVMPPGLDSVEPS